MRNNRFVNDTTHGLIHFPLLTLQVKTASNEKTAKNPQRVIPDDALTIPPRKTKRITAFVYHPSERNNTGTVTPLEKFTKTAGLLIFQSMSTKTKRRIAVMVTNTMESPYLMKKNARIAEFSVVTPEQSKHIKPVDMTIFSMIPPSDLGQTAYLNELLRRNKPQQQNDTFWFPTLEKLGRSEDHTPKQIQLLKELIGPKEKEKLNPQESTESRNKLLKRFHWTNTFLTDTVKQAIEDILFDYHDIFARHRIDFGMDTEFKVKPTPKNHKTVYNQSLPMQTHLKENLIVKLALIRKFWIIAVLPLSKYASPNF